MSSLSGPRLTRALLGALVLAPAAGRAADTDPPATPQRVEVSGNSSRNSYLQTDGSGALRVDADIREVPASMQMISPQLIRDQAAGQTINAVLHNASGVSQTYGSGTGNLPAVSIRGFDSGGYTLVDGYPRTNGGSYDWSAIDRLEILKGPASLLYGMQYSIGGSINVVTKKPTLKPVAEVSLEVGSWDHYRSAIDLGGPVGDSGTLAYRINAAVDRSRSFRDALFDHNTYLAPSLRWTPTPDDTLLLRADLHQHRYLTDPGLPGPGASWAANDLSYYYPGPSRERMGFDLPVTQYLGLSDWDSYHDTNRTLLVEWEHSFNDDWKLKLGVSPAWMTYQGQWSYYWWEQPTDDLGNTLPVVSHLSGGRYGYRSKEVPVNIDLTGRFRTGPVEHRLLVGGAYTDARFRDTGAANNTQLVAAGPVGLLDWLNPPRAQFVPDPDALPGAYAYFQRAKGLYVQDLIALGEEWKFLLGWRYDTAAGGWWFTYGPDRYDGSFKSSGGTPRAGVVWQPSRRDSYYLSWSRSFNPNWGRLVDGSIPPPERGVQTEVGWKHDFDDGKTNLNVAAYRLVKRNVERCAPQDPDCRLYVLGGQQSSQGLEFDLNGEPLPHLRLTASLTLQSGARVDKDLPADSPYAWGGALPVGNRFPGGPRRMASFFGVYTLQGDTLPGLELGGGVNYSAASEQNLPNDGYRLPGERTVNLYAAYPLTPRVHVQLNVNNVTNRLAYSSPGWQGWPWLYFANKPREFVLAVTAQFGS